MQVSYDTGTSAQKGATTSSANLFGADLTGANLATAQLRNAELTRAKLSGAEWVTSGTCEPGSVGMCRLEGTTQPPA